MVKRKDKKADISVIEEGLEGKRHQERVLGGIIAEKKNDDLYFVDVQGDAESAKKSKQKRLKIDEILTPNSKIAAVASKKKSLKEKNTVAKIAKKLIKKPVHQEKPVEKADPNIWADDGKHIPMLKPVKEKVPDFLHPGMSYKPHPVDHSKLIMEAASVEFKKIEEAQKIQDQLSFAPELLEKPSMEERANEELFEEDASSSGDEEEIAEKIVFTAKATKRKTKSERNKEERRRAIESVENERKEQNRLAKQIDQLGYIKKELKGVRPAENNIHKERKRKIKVKELAMPVQLTDEVAESLRLLKPEGNLMKECFVGFQKKAYIEMRVPQKPKKKRVKEFEKRSYKYIE